MTKLPIKLKRRKFYDFYRDGVTSSFIQKWLQCPEQCRLCYVEGWVPKNFNDAVFFGNIVHYVLEHAYSSERIPLPNEVKGYIDQYRHKTDNLNLSSEQLEKNELAYARAEAVLQNYFIRYMKDFSDRWVFAETMFKVPYQFSDGTQTFISGKLDGGFEQEDKLWLMDHKTMSKIDLDRTITLFPVDIQVNLYLYCTYWIRKQEGKPLPRGLKYNMIRHPQNKKTSKHADYDAFIEDLIEKIQNDWGYYFYRYSHKIFENEILNWKKQYLDPIMENIKRWWDTKFRIPGIINPLGLNTKYGLSEYAPIILHNDYSRFYKKEKPFIEL